MDYRKLPVYTHRDKILEALKSHQVIVVESPTGSGKTTQLPVILHEAGYSDHGMIGVTQPRRIAAVSVSDFIRRQTAAKTPELVGYKMRFDDKTSRSTKIKIMTDGILLQEMKLDQTLSQYSVLMVDEAHERSLNIDFVLGLLKRVLEARPEFKVIVSSATINADIFSRYFNDCPVVRIETSTYPVEILYAPPVKADDESRLARINELVAHVLDEKRGGDILIFLPGEKVIKDCITSMLSQTFRKKIHPIPLYGRLSKEEQDMVFPDPPWGKTKIVVSTNIAETSLTIEGVTVVIDSGQAKLNYYNPRTYTSTLMEKPISKASANQRKGRAGRTQAGSCYRLYSREEFESRPLFTQEEIYRTDLSEVVLRMAELGIRDFDKFDFISSPGKAGIAGAVENLHLLEALNPDNSLSTTGTMMAMFPLLPRHSRIIVEAVMRYPDVTEEAVIAASFLSTDSPYLLPQGEELEARKAHHFFRDATGDFMSYLKLYRAYMAAEKKPKFCETYYLDPQSMGEIANIKDQLEQIVSSMGIPIGHGGDVSDYLCAVAKGLIQFVCFRVGKGYRSLTGESVDIHPGSVMYRETPPYIVAGEIVRTSRMYARSVAALRKEWLDRISPSLAKSVRDEQGTVAPGSEREHERERSRERPGRVEKLAPGKKVKASASGIPAGAPGHGPATTIDPAYSVQIGGRMFTLKAWKGKKKMLELPWEDAKPLSALADEAINPAYADLRTVVLWQGSRLLDGEKLDRVLAIVRFMNLPADLVDNGAMLNKMNLWEHPAKLEAAVGNALKVVRAKKGDANLAFLTLYTNDDGIFWMKPSKGFTTALHESLASLEFLADTVDKTQFPALATAVGRQLGRLGRLIEEV